MGNLMKELNKPKKLNLDIYTTKNNLEFKKFDKITYFDNIIKTNLSQSPVLLKDLENSFLTDKTKLNSCEESDSTFEK